MARRALGDRVFILWVAVGALGAAMAVLCSYKCPSLDVGERTFHAVGVGVAPEKQSEYDRWAARLAVLANGSLVYGFLGVVAFFRRGCVVFIAAAGFVVICELARLVATGVPL